MSHEDIRLDIFTAPTVKTKFWKAEHVTWGDVLGWAETPADHKECGGYVFGSFSGKLRRNADLIDRQVIALDFDHAAEGVPAALDALGVEALWHTSYSHAPDDFRCRVLIPLDRRVSGPDYEVIAESLAQKLGPDAVDRTSFRPAQFMWKPSTQQLDWYRHGHVSGPLANATELIGSYDSAMSESMRPARPRHQKRDPYDMPGLAGSFNSAYRDLDTLIETFELPYVKEGENRYRHVESKSVAGMGEIHGAPGVYFSHHANDEAGLQACTAFDLVRIHKFSDLDARQSPQTPITRLKSYDAMLELAVNDPLVKAEHAASARDVFADLDPSLSDLNGSSDDDDDNTDWRVNLSLNRQGQVTDTVGNLDLIVEHDPVFRGLRYSELLLDIVTVSPFPWDNGSRPVENVSDHDIASLGLYLERTYELHIPKSRIDQVIAAHAVRRRFNPLQDRLNSLEWDGVPRMETCLPGVAVNAYTRMVARKSILGAVARALDPGVKMDLTLILYGSEGVGKTRWINAMGLEPRYVASLEHVGSKDTYLAMNRSWIMISDEVESLRRADFDALKSFLTKTHDNYRVPYDRGDVQRARRCVVWGTTNDPKFLRRQEGNRRFLIVHCEEAVDEETLVPEYIEQVWAEAIVAYRAGEQLYLTPSEEDMAREARAVFTQEEPLLGLVASYLDMNVPDHWDLMSPEDRGAWFAVDRYISPATDQTQSVTCAAAIYREVMGETKTSIGDRDMHRITDALNSSPGWAPGGVRKTPYGLQETYVRVSLAEQAIADLI